MKELHSFLKCRVTLENLFSVLYAGVLKDGKALCCGNPDGAIKWSYGTGWKMSRRRELQTRSR